MIIGLTYYACNPRLRRLTVMEDLFQERSSPGLELTSKEIASLVSGNTFRYMLKITNNNTMEPRTFGALGMSPTESVQGKYLLKSLMTWKVICRKNRIEMTLSWEVIDFINRQALNSTKITSDIEMRVGNNIIGDNSICEEMQEINDPENDGVLSIPIP